MKSQESKLKTQDQNVEDKFRLVTRAADKFATRQSLIAYIIGVVGSVALIGSMLLFFTISDKLSAGVDADRKIALLESKYPNYNNWIWVWKFENDIEKTSNQAANKYYWKYRHDHPTPNSNK